MSRITRWRRKPYAAEAMQLTDEASAHDMAVWCAGRVSKGDDFVSVEVPILHGIFYVEEGQWLVRDVLGSFHVWDDLAFRGEYEPFNALREAPRSGAGKQKWSVRGAGADGDAGTGEYGLE